jgi:SAM-dependent methyltransferase
MVELASRRAGERGLGQVSFVRTDMESPFLEAASFDAAICAFGLMFAADFGAALRELYRVLKPGGRLAVVVWGRRARCGWAEVFPIVERRVTSDVCPLFFGLGAPGALEAALADAGFTGVEAERPEGVLEWPDGETAIDAMLRGGAVALAYDKFTPEVREEVRREYEASIEPFRGATGYHIPAEFVIATARRPIV